MLGPARLQQHVRGFKKRSDKKKQKTRPIGLHSPSRPENDESLFAVGSSDSRGLKWSNNQTVGRAKTDRNVQTEFFPIS